MEGQTSSLLELLATAKNTVTNIRNKKKGEMGKLLLQAGVQNFVPNDKTTAISKEITNSVKITLNISNFKKLPVTANSGARIFS